MAKGKYQQWLTEDGQTLLRGWRRAGLTDEEIADKMGISNSTFYAWKQKYSEISEALKKGKQICDFEAEEALQKQFNGFYVYEETTEINEVDGVQKKHIKKVKKWVPANTTAIIFYLKCRGGWKEADKDQITATSDSEISGDTTVNIYLPKKEGEE